MALLGVADQPVEHRTPGLIAMDIAVFMAIGVDDRVGPGGLAPIVPLEPGIVVAIVGLLGYIDRPARVPQPVALCLYRVMLIFLAHDQDRLPRGGDARGGTSRLVATPACHPPHPAPRPPVPGLAIGGRVLLASALS